MFHIANRIPRRRFLRNLGALLALPALECMTARGAQPSSPKRMLLMSNNLGVLPPFFFPKSAGPDYTPSPCLAELQEFRKDFTVFSGLSHPAVAGGHQTENCFLTAAPDPTRSGFRNTLSLDQFAAEALGNVTRFSNLNLGVNLDPANRSLSWTRDGVLLPAETKPSALFRKMFVAGTSEEVQRQLHRLRQRNSVLDSLREDLSRFQQGLGAQDRTRLDQYVTSLRELEERLALSAEWELKPKPTTAAKPPEDISDKAKFFPKLQLMLEIAHLAFASDSTRIITLMIDGLSTPALEIDATEKTKSGYHGLSHHSQSGEKIAELQKIDLQQMRHLRALFSALAGTPAESGDRLLDHTMVLYGSNLGDANVHNTTNLPILLAGGGFRHGQHLAFDAVHNKPLCNLFLSLLHQFGVPAAGFGSSTGVLSEIHT